MSDAQRAWVHDTNICVRCANPESVFRSVLLALKRIGHDVSRDPRIERDYKILSKSHRLAERKGSQGSLWISCQWFPAGIELTGWQNVVYTNPHGGQHDFNKLAKMPYLIRLSWLKSLRVVVDVLSRRGIAMRPPDPEWSVDPLAAFNSQWGAERFARDGTGWPANSELCRWRQDDADGTPLRPGEHRYVAGPGQRWWRVQVYGGINGMWTGVCGAGITCHNAGGYFSRLPGDRRRRAVGATLARQGLTKAFRAAIERQDYSRAAAVSRAAAARGIELCVSCECRGGAK